MSNVSGGWGSILNLQLHFIKGSRTPKLRNVHKRPAEPHGELLGPLPPSKPPFLKHISSFTLQNVAFPQNNYIKKAPTRADTLIYFANMRSSPALLGFFPAPSSPTPPFFCTLRQMFFPPELKAVQKQDHTRRLLRRPARRPPPPPHPASLARRPLPPGARALPADGGVAFLVAPPLPLRTR